jgi:hypothetical protein
MELDLIKCKLDLIYYKNMLNTSKKLKIKNNFIEDIIEKLENNENSIEDSESKVSDVQNTPIIYSEDYVYKKPWTKLASVHKIIKMKEFVNKLFIEDYEDKKELIKKLKLLVKNKILTKKDKVNYDKIKGRIISIPDLVYKNNKYYI